MKKIPILPLALLVLSTACSPEIPEISLRWELSEGDGSYENIFYIRNHGNSPLHGGWEVYYGQLPVAFRQSDIEAGVTVTQICGTHYRMAPSEFYRAIRPGDSLRVVLETPLYGGQVSFEPRGAYIVFEKGDGSECREIPLVKELFSGVSANPRYNDGKEVYDFNSRFSEPVELSMTDIFPSPKQITTGSGTFVFGREAALSYPEELTGEAALLKKTLEEVYGCEIVEEAPVVISLSTDPAGSHRNEEHYRIRATGGRIAISGATPHAVFNGTQTLLAMVGAADLPVYFPETEISDWPDFAHRGQMIDVSRNFTRKQDLMRLIDILSSYKINTLHLHLADDEGWRLEIPGLPELTEVGARRGHTLTEEEFLYPAYGSGWDPDDPGSSGNGYYTREDFIEILRYTGSRHIKVIPEIDMPGHSRAAIKAMNARYRKYRDSDPEKAEEYLLSDFEDRSIYSSAQEYTDNVINAAMPSAYRFVRKVIDEVESIYADAGVKLETFHIGGDEIPRGSWTESPIADAFMEENGIAGPHALKNLFVERVYEMLDAKGIGMAGWQEIVLGPDNRAEEMFRGRNIVSNCWNTAPEWECDHVPYNLANAGYEIIISAVTNLYLDLTYDKGYSEPGHNWGGHVDEYKPFDVLPFDIYKSVRWDMEGDPVYLAAAGAGKEKLLTSARGNIRGMQGQLWAETIHSLEDIEYLLLPKIMGLAERAWNARPEWSSDPMGKGYFDALELYNAKITQREMPRLSHLGLTFHIGRPGVMIAGNRLYINSPIHGADVRYTTDGEEPTLNSMLWEGPVPCYSKTVRAKTFYLGRESKASTSNPD